MQAKNKHSNQSDSQWADQGWAKMQQLLDREMPATPARRPNGQSRYLLLLLLLLIAFTAGAGLVWWWAAEQPDASAPVKTVEKELPIAKAKPLPNLPDTDHMAAILHEPLLKAGIGEGLGPPGQVIAPPNETAASIFQQNKEYDLSFTKPNQIPQSVESTAKALEISALDALSSTLATAEKAAQPPVEVASLLPTLVPEVSKNNRNPLTKIRLKPKPVWRFGVNAGLLAGGLTSSDGWELGLLAERKLDSRFAVQAGLGYRQINKSIQANYIDDPLRDQVILGPDPIVDTLILDPSMNSIKDIYGLERKVGSLPIARMAYLNVPVQMVYRINHWLRISSGMELSWLLHTALKYENNEGAYDPSLIAFNNQTDVPDKVRGGIRRLNVSASAGLSAVLCKGLEIGVHYYHGLHDFTKDDAFGIRQVDAHEFVSLQLKYFL